MKPSDGGWRRENECDRAANGGRLRNGESNPAGDERNDAGGKPKDEGADDAGVIVECGECGSDADEKWRRVDGERKQQPAEEAGAEESESESDDDHSGGLREKRVLTVAPSTTTAAQVQYS